MDWSAIIPAGVLAVLGGGAVGGLIGPWVQLAVEHRRETRAHRRQSIETWRAMVGRHMDSSTRVIHDPDYVSLRGHLRPEVLKQLELSAYLIPLTEGAEGISAAPKLDEVSKEIDRLERVWKLA